MRFDLTDEQKLLQDNLEALFAAEIDANRLAVAQGDEIAALRAKLDESLAGIGLPGALVSEAHGGLGLGLLTLAAAAEIVGRHAAPTTALTNALAAWIVSETAPKEERARWLEPLMIGQARAAIAFANADAPILENARLNGACAHVEAGESADVFIVACAGGALALTPKSEAISASTPAPLDQTRPTSTLRFENAAATRLEADEDFCARLRDAQIVLLAADAHGAGQRAFDITLDYAKTRHQFGRPIGANQGVKHQLANMCVSFTPARFLVWYAAHAWDVIPEARAHAAALAKAHAPSAAVALARAAVEAHGAIGYTWEYPLHIYLKRAMYDRAACGGPAHHRARAASLAGW